MALGGRRSRVCVQPGGGSLQEFPAPIIKEMVEIVRSPKELAYFGFVEFGMGGRASQEGSSVGQGDKPSGQRPRFGSWGTEVTLQGAGPGNGRKRASSHVPRPSRPGPRETGQPRVWGRGVPWPCAIGSQPRRLLGEAGIRWVPFFSFPRPRNSPGGARISPRAQAGPF